MTLPGNFHKYPKDRKSHYLMGVEIETSNSNASGTYNFLSGTEFIMKSDGSLNGYNPIEFCSLPLPEKRLKIKVQKLYKLIEPSVNYSCGLHVHISRSIANERIVYNLRQEFRDMSDSEYFELAGRTVNTYCNRRPSYSDEKYQAVNTNHADTYEIRIFAASSKIEWVCRCIDVTRALFQYRQPKGLSWYDGFRIYFEKRFGYNFEDIKP